MHVIALVGGGGELNDDLAFGDEFAHFAVPEREGWAEGAALRRAARGMRLGSGKDAAFRAIAPGGEGSVVGAAGEVAPDDVLVGAT
ncbi:MAG: hypothetical protein LBP58_06865 [Azoarcus sp.]|jgi:hypothetical protein|nr:hypothetical protein [Azoarcus sp.]